MSRDGEIAEAVGRVYEDIDLQIRERGVSCRACGQCCDFLGYDHRLYVTSAEMVYFKRAVGSDDIEPMIDGVCPYNTGGKCRVHGNRFAGCRIFYCKGDDEFQSRLMESAIAEFKKICEAFDLAYWYVDLSAALK